MEANLLLKELDELATTEGNIINLLDNYFFTGNFEHQVGLISNAIQEVVNKGSDDTDPSLDNSFGYTNRYIRESVNDLTELQKFLIRLHIVYVDCKRKSNELLMTDLD